LRDYPKVLILLVLISTLLRYKKYCSLFFGAALAAFRAHIALVASGRAVAVTFWASTGASVIMYCSKFHNQSLFMSVLLSCQSCLTPSVIYLLIQWVVGLKTQR